MRRHGGSLLKRVIQTFDGIRKGSVAIFVEDCNRHELDIGSKTSDASNSCTVVSGGCDDTSTVRSVSIEILIGTSSHCDIPAVDIVHISVVVVIDAVSWNLAGVHPHVLRKVGMRDLDAGVDDSHDDLLSTVGHRCSPLPGLCDAGAVHAPLEVHPGIRDFGGLHEEFDLLIHLNVLEIVAVLVLNDLHSFLGGAHLGAVHFSKFQIDLR
mmetsp:Transcript_52056/g.110684  ORF Transcript_52056/g.110684 Transcript_52056/m.110684 type:complete len:210 (-) Transcript_52056:304-933(-)